MRFIPENGMSTESRKSATIGRISPSYQTRGIVIIGACFDLRSGERAGMGTACGRVHVKLHNP